MSIQSEIDRLTAAKNSIAASLQTMGVEPPEGTTLDQYAAQLAAIAASAPWLPLAGGTMTGALVLSGDPTANNQAAPKSYVDSLAATSTTITLAASGWSSNVQTVTVSGVKATGQNVRLSPVTKADADAWASAGCWCTAQAENALTFTCDTVPAQDIQLNVEMQEVQS